MSAPRYPRKALTFGLGGLVGGFLLAFLGYGVLGRVGTTAADVAAGILVVLGLTAMLMAVLAFLLPPLLPAR